MSAWPGKYVIGLTGNIASGKSVVRKMLEHLGAYGIDADGLAHRVISKGAPGYEAVVDYFGRWILRPDGQIDRARLGKLVFADPQALQKLEAIIHPYVSQAVDILVKRARQNVIVIEAIKLLETPLREACDAIWVTTAPEEVRLDRLVKRRRMDEAEARERLAAQSPQEAKIAQADVVIENEGSFEETWFRVVEAWKQTFPAPIEKTEEKAKPSPQADQLIVERGTPHNAEEIAAFITRLSNGKRHLTRQDVMEMFGEKAFMLLRRGEQLVGLVGWQVENLVTRVLDLVLYPDLNLPDEIRDLMDEVEKASLELQSEAALLFLPPRLARKEQVWNALGYERRAIENLSVRAWQEAARESWVKGTVLMFKQLREDRVLRPM